MHEGVLILAKSDNSIMLSNKPTQKLIKKFLNNENCLLKKSFGSLKFTLNSSVSEGTLPYCLDSVGKKSLEEIVLAQIDEPNQKNCIYNIKRTTDAVLGEEIEKYF